MRNSIKALVAMAREEGKDTEERDRRRRSDRAVFKNEQDRRRVLDKDVKETETKTDLSDRKTEASQRDNTRTNSHRAKRRQTRSTRL
jgi:hypothetical protein